MQSDGNQLKDHFRSELSALRGEAAEFSASHPNLAHALGLNSQQATDPQAEILLQSFAYLTGRLRYQQTLDQAGLANALIAFLYPHLEAPIPSMFIAEITPKSDSAAFTKEQVLARGRYVSAMANNDQGNQVECRFRTCFETPLLPLNIDAIELVPAMDYAAFPEAESKQSILRVKIKTAHMGRLQTKGKQRLRFYINSNEEYAFRIYDCLSNFLCGIAIHVPGSGNLIMSELNQFRWLGFSDDEAMLDLNPHTHPGYRVLQEYFSFRDKFLFFEVSGLDFSTVQTEFDLLFFLNMPYDSTLGLSVNSLKLNCVPMINLFARRLEPIALDQTEYEYRLQGDIENHRYCEIHSVLSLESIKPDGGPRPITPYFDLDQISALEDQDYFFVTRREPSQSSNIPGSELFVSLLDSQFDTTQLLDEVIGGKALCTNRRLAEQLRPDSKLYLEGSGPIDKITALNKPTLHFLPDLVGARPWALVSQLALNHLSLAEGPHALRALKEILRLHVGGSRVQGLREIDGINALHCRQVTRRMGQENWRGFVRGMHITLEMDPRKFERGSATLFCSVLRHFFCLYATVNSLIEVSMANQNNNGSEKQWQAMVGAQKFL